MVRKWLTIPQLQDQMINIISTLPCPAEIGPPVPVYLLERQSAGDIDTTGE